MWQEMQIERDKEEEEEEEGKKARQAKEGKRWNQLNKLTSECVCVIHANKYTVATSDNKQPLTRVPILVTQATGWREIKLIFVCPPSGAPQATERNCVSSWGERPDPKVGQSLCTNKHTTDPPQEKNTERKRERKRDNCPSHAYAKTAKSNLSFLLLLLFIPADVVFCYPVDATAPTLTLQMLPSDSIRVFSFYDSPQLFFSLFSSFPLSLVKWLSLLSSPSSFFLSFQIERLYSSSGSSFAAAACKFTRRLRECESPVSKSSNLQ